MTVSHSMRLMILFSLGLITAGTLRWATTSVESFHGLSAIPTPLYVALSVYITIRVVRSPTGWAGIGVGIPPKPAAHLALGVSGAVAAVLAGDLLEPVWIFLFESGRDLSRFDETVTSVPGLIALLALNWSFAAFGEEFAFRGLLMRGLTSALGDNRCVTLVPYLVQAGIFGLVHAYQGPAGVAGATVSGLVFGGVVWIAQGSLWPAVLSHGLSNTYGIVTLWMQANSVAGT